MLCMIMTMIDEPKQQDLFRQLYQKHNEALRAYAWKLMQRVPHLTDDVLQETWISILPHLDRISVMPENGARAYLFAAVKHSAIKLLDKEPSHVVSMQEITEELPAATDVLNEVCVNDACRQLVQTILSLPESLQEVLYLHYLSAMNFREIAAYLHLPYTAVYKRFQRGKDCLVQKLQEGGVFAHEKK